MSADLKIVINADIDIATKQVDNFSKAVTELSKDVNTTAASFSKINPALATVQTGLAKTAMAASKMDSSLAKVGSGGANQATNALTNLGRVVQDAPFGFIGIANNINPLLESFQRLQKEAGGTKGALKTLVGSLAGAGGLGLAVSIGTAALSLFGMAMQKSGSEAKKAAEKTDEYGKTVQGIAGKIAEQVGNVDVLVKAYQRENISQKERISIIEELKRISPEYFNQLNKEKTSVDQLTVAYNAYAVSIDKSIIAELKRERLKTLITRRIQLQVEFNQNEKAEDPLKALFNQIPKDAEKAIDKTANIFRKKNPFDKKIFDPKSIGFDEFKNGIDQINSLNREIGNLEIDLAKSIDIKKPDVDKNKKSLETIGNVLASLRREIELLNQTELLLSTNETDSKISAIQSAISRLSKDFKVSPKDTIITKLFGDILELTPGIERFKQLISDVKVTTTAQILIDQAQAQKEIDDKLGKDKRIKPIKLDIDMGDAFRKLQEMYKYIDQANKDMAATVTSTLNQAFASIGESIATSLSTGANFGETVFGNLFKVIGAGLKQLGEAMIGLGTVKIALEKFKIAPGIGTVLAGIAAVALGSLLQNAIPGFANGVTNFRGGMALVGERGPELVRLPRGSDVIPNGRTNDIMAGVQTIHIVGSSTVQGTQLLTVWERANAQRGRNG